jgi:hypothetical protein
METYMHGWECHRHNLPAVSQRVGVTNAALTHTRIAIFEPSTTNVRVLLIDDMLDVLKILLDVVCIHDPGNSTANRQDTDFARVRTMENNICDDAPVNTC